MYANTQVHIHFGNEKKIPMKTFFKGLKLHHYNKYILITWINLIGSHRGSLAENSDSIHQSKCR